MVAILAVFGIAAGIDRRQAGSYEWSVVFLLFVGARLRAMELCNWPFKRFLGVAALDPGYRLRLRLWEGLWSRLC